VLGLAHGGVHRGRHHHHHAHYCELKLAHLKIKVFNKTFKGEFQLSDSACLFEFFSSFFRVTLLTQIQGDQIGRDFAYWAIV
jgi:hypothetical protein